MQCNNETVRSNTHAHTYTHRRDVQPKRFPGLKTGAPKFYGLQRPGRSLICAEGTVCGKCSTFTWLIRTSEKVCPSMSAFVFRLQRVVAGMGQTLSMQQMDIYIYIYERVFRVVCSNASSRHSAAPSGLQGELSSFPSFSRGIEI